MKSIYSTSFDVRSFDVDVRFFVTVPRVLEYTSIIDDFVSSLQSMVDTDFGDYSSVHCTRLDRCMYVVSVSRSVPLDSKPNKRHTPDVSLACDVRLADYVCGAYYRLLAYYYPDCTCHCNRK